MAGRGRGARSFSVDSVGISRDSLPVTVQQPTPEFPVMEQKPLPLTGGEEVEYLLALKQDLRAAMKSLPCFIQPVQVHKDVERYSDKYHLNEHSKSLKDWTLDWKRFPKELRLHVRRPHSKGAVLSSVQSGQKKEQEQEQEEGRQKEQVLLNLETLEKKEEQESSEEEGEQEKKQEKEEQEPEEEYDEEEFEEETDYSMPYFDNGEDFGGDSDDNMDEAIY
ncbi:DNA-directed RNA polymerase III subunit RPC7-like [Austrofundulus limnaeus]|uniref:DNA-directed RNA polymerase III subunit RPC7-like n=1 Tax=Austrofundulus limnaeus TaxID=52670 RepID=A0A2I4DCH0_AUSLI|nr:PREDICTED: DNA-directed RNA polymerase III subunit RPC7-like [Austrofundulus limnaeus]XP_013889939.1 PREDICTED: DNA-directed RNA polymerase III subunit RPC7-like [Austrofundulus limnaeus]